MLLVALFGIAPFAFGQNLDLDQDGVADFEIWYLPGNGTLTESWWVPQRSNSVWVAKSSGQPIFYPHAGGVWSETNGPAGMWSEPGANYMFQRIGVERDWWSGGDEIFIHEGLLATSSVETDPSTFLVVRYATKAGWKIAWLQYPRFKAYRVAIPRMPGLPWPELPMGPASMSPVDIGVYPGSPPESLVLGVKSPGRDQRLRIKILTLSSDFRSSRYLIETGPEGLGDLLEWSRDPLAGPWTPIWKLPLGYADVFPGSGIPATGPVFFRLR